MFLSVSTLSHSAEGASGIYVLGTQGPLAGVLPPPGFYIRNDDYFYQGHATNATLAGLLSFQVKAHCFLNFTTLTAVAAPKVLGGNYGCGAVFPVGRIKCHADVSIDPLNLTVSRSHTDYGYSDMIVYPIMLGWHFNSFHLMTSLGVFLPTGHFQKGRLANIGRNHYALDPGVGWTYECAKWGLELSSWTGYTVNFKNHETQYRSGGELHTEFFAGKWLGKHVQLGCIGYYYDQITKDRGRGAVLGGFEGSVTALGPLLLCAFQWGKVPTRINARYYHEFDATNRLQGNAFFVTATFSFIKK